MDQATSTDPVLWSVDERNVAYVTLNRPQVYNAYNGDMIAALLAVKGTIAIQGQTRRNRGPTQP